MTQRLGKARVNITPDFEVELSGFAARIQPSAGVRDPVFLRAIFLEERKERLLWLHADLLAFTNELAAGVKADLGRRFGLKPRQVVLTATHTHSAPVVQPLLCAGEDPGRYVSWLLPRIEQAAEEAMAKTEPVNPCFNEGHCGLTRDRRGGGAAHTDTRMATLGWRRPDGTWAALLAHYSIHPVAFSWENRRISSDLFGVAACTLEENLPGGPTVLLVNGAAANQNPPHLTDDEEQVRSWGGEIADSIVAVLSKAKPLGETGVRTAATVLPVPLETLEESAATVDRYLQNVQERSGELAAIATSRDADFLFGRLRAAGIRWRERMALQERAGHLPPHLDVALQVVAIGEISFVCFAAEIFSIMTDELRSATGERVYVVGYANGYNGYLCPEAVYAEGGYEPNMAFIFGAIPRPRRGAHEVLRAGVTALLKQFYDPPAGRVPPGAPR